MLQKKGETILLKSHQRLFVLMSILACALTLGVAQETPASPWGYSGGVGLTFSGIKSIAASANGIGENPWGIQLNGGIQLFRYLLFNTDVGVEFPGDHQKFEQSTTGGHRSIDNCVDCRQDDIELNDGTYLQPVLQILFDAGDEDRFGIGISYRVYSVDTDLKGRLVITFLKVGLF
jgi:hypothetical protein